ncbi:MAG TPA: response regulator transcription factor [Phycisphaerae bacterium]|nr:response regulator transcription factor [Phycisphaerae bacterium]HOJ74072.1 response regulator transcription factor [Phycisphaerae bacterium]HOM50667.1 response regulator transcription factor [Phycisphaerae bacterium]HPP26149.1 response regulator transcription factor [Phycisphaerae bacterium]HPU28685.1 response regulator transcription factor [Phycisphaerae bacterium]
MEPRSNARSILIVEDEADLAEVLKFNLEREGYQCRWAPDGGAALAELEKDLPDLILLDRMLPGVSGDKLIAEIRKAPDTSGIPVIMITAKADETDQLVGFAIGADDYITKPFSVKLVVARVAALFRRVEAAESTPEVLAAGPIRLDPERHCVTVSGEPTRLTATEFKFLRALMAAGGRVLDRNRLLDLVLGKGTAVTDRTVDVHITSLRKKLGSAAGWVQTVRGVGYTFRKPA